MKDSLVCSITPEEIRLLVAAATRAMAKAYVPYSHFPVGAALLTDDGTIYEGCNIENASYSLTICAERTAIFTALAKGERKFKALAVAAKTSNPLAPCGACRQVIAEFHIPAIIMANQTGEYKVMSLEEILPYSFSSEDLTYFGEDNND